MMQLQKFPAFQAVAMEKNHAGMLFFTLLNKVIRGILEESQKFNFLGNPPIDDHIRNAMGFVRVIHGFTGENQRGKYTISGQVGEYQPWF